MNTNGTSVKVVRPEGCVFHYTMVVNRYKLHHTSITSMQIHIRIKLKVWTSTLWNTHQHIPFLTDLRFAENSHSGVGATLCTCAEERTWHHHQSCKQEVKHKHTYHKYWETCVYNSPCPHLPTLQPGCHPLSKSTSPSSIPLSSNTTLFST